MTNFTQADTVELFKTVVDKKGDIYYPGVYNLGRPLPVQFLTSEFVRPLEAPRHEVEEVNSYLRKTKEAEQELVITNQQSSNTVEEINIGEQKVEEETPKSQSSLINVNEATVEELIVLNGVGRKVASKIIELRELHPFGSISDLNDRVKLPTRTDWADFKDLIVF